MGRAWVSVVCGYVPGLIPLFEISPGDSSDPIIFTSWFISRKRDMNSNVYFIILPPRDGVHTSCHSAILLHGQSPILYTTLFLLMGESFVVAPAFSLMHWLSTFFRSIQIAIKASRGRQGEPKVRESRSLDPLHSTNRRVHPGEESGGGFAIGFCLEELFKTEYFCVSVISSRLFKIEYFSAYNTDLE
ncbi:hypothetical protein KSP40_PGU000621 [Platanthera guangdongensis]|uniref:Uncharacterized protein n=1 Tax=Platanthera guangdongensis TaxID=2320717 RepID=A0ABR2MDZ2_9ASPA